MDVNDIPAKKSRVIFEEHQFAFKQNLDDHQVPLCSSVAVFPDNKAAVNVESSIYARKHYKSNISNCCADEPTPVQKVQILDDMLKETFTKCSVHLASKVNTSQRHNCKDTNYSASASPHKTYFSKIFIKTASILYSSRVSKEGFPKKFLLNILESSTYGSQELLKTIFLNNSIFEQNPEPQSSHEVKKKKKLPKRYWQMRQVFQELIENHKKCPYMALLKNNLFVKDFKIHSKELLMPNKGLSSLESASSACGVTIDSKTLDSGNTRMGISKITAKKKIIKSIIAKGNRIATEKTMQLNLLKKHTKPWQVYVFVRACLHKVVPEFLWGSSHNKCRFLKNVKTFIYSGKFYKMSLQELLWNMRVENCVWLRLLKHDHYVPASEHLHRERVLARFLYWLMDSYVIQLLKSFYYITESSFQKKKMFFYRKCIWNKIQNIGLRKHFKKVKMSLLSSGEIENMQQQKPGPLVSRLRFIPKKIGLRAISKMCDTLERHQSKDKKIQHFMSQVANLFSVLNYECSKSPTLLGSTVFGMDDIYKKWKTYGLKLRASKAEINRFYFVKTDVEGAYDNIPLSKLSEVVSKVINPNTEEVYCIRRYASVWMDSAGCIRKSFKRNVSTLADFLPNMKQFVSYLQNHDQMQNCILVEQSLSLNESSSKLLAFLQQIISNHILCIKDQFYLQSCGIPQGSMLSTLLCNLCYGDMENKLLCGIQQNGLLLRLVDDFLLVTPHLEKAKEFLRILAEGIPQYGCSISSHKTMVNFPTSDTPKCTKVEQFLENWFPWCGLLFDTHTLDIYYDYSSYMKTSIRSSLTFCQSVAAGTTMRNKLIRILKLKCHSILLDLKMNSLQTVFFNIYKMFFLQAYRFHACAVQLPFNQSVRRNPSFFLTVISDMAPCCYSALKGNNKKSTVGYKDVTDPFPFEAAQWLACHAFITKLTKHKNLYKCLLGPIKNCKQYLSRKLPQITLQLLNTVVNQTLHEGFSTILD
ncbi:telomerase reverse transcriptase [Discoglossus pictus]